MKRKEEEEEEMNMGKVKGKVSFYSLSEFTSKCIYLLIHIAITALCTSKE